MRRNFRYFRYLVLLLVLGFVIVHEGRVKDRVSSWDETLKVQIYAVNGDGRAATSRYIKNLQPENFEAVGEFMNREAKRYGIPIEVVSIHYGGQLESLPPQPPTKPSLLNNIGWSLHFRSWSIYQSFKNDKKSLDINLYISYYDTSTTRALRHSVGLQRGLIGLINGFASKDYEGSNNVVIAHELMHTIGASDKYDHLNQPVYPSGYADPYLIPRYPQHWAEIMGGRIPINTNHSKIPEKLGQVVVGAYSAAEIGWYEQ